MKKYCASKSGQSLQEYVVVITIIILVLLAIAYYINRGIVGRGNLGFVPYTLLMKA